MPDREPLFPLAFRPLPLGSIRPAGWLLSQLRIQARGLSGHLDEFWPDIAESGWIGGKAEGWERGPYWLDGVVPLAFLLDDADLKTKVHRWIEYILAHQHSDGWLGPLRAPDSFHRYGARDPWPVAIVMKAMSQYFDATGDEKVIAAMTRFLRRLDTLLDDQPMSAWGKYRGADLILSIHWLFDQTGDAWLLDVAAKVYRQSFAWREHFANFQYMARVTRQQLMEWERETGDELNNIRMATHVVNNAMAIKSPGVWFRQSHDPADRDAADQIIATLDHWHGQATGVFSGDEQLAGRSPSQGTELCAVVEYMFSLETLLSIVGKAVLADRLERIAFNALPATFAPDMWAHQYDQQVNQVVCRVSEDNVFANNGPDANIFGLEPNFGCCTANMHQGWPKLASSLWMRKGDSSLAAIVYGPCKVWANLAGAAVQVETQTEYPFGEDVRIVVKMDRPAEFELLLRVPDWAKGAEVRVANEDVKRPAVGRFLSIRRRWQDGEQVQLHLPMGVRVERRFNGAATIHRGPLVYSLKIGERWRHLRGQLPHADWEVHPTTSWNYALHLDLTDPARSIFFERRSLGECAFSPEGAPMIARVQGSRVPTWEIEHNAAAPPPVSPVNSREPVDELTLIPYGCTNLRVTEFPTLASS